MSLTTRILPVAEPASLGHYEPADSIEHWEAAAPGDPRAPGRDAVAAAAQSLRETDVPVGFPTETVYGLAADASRSQAVRGIFAVKGRPSDNPLIVHVCDLAMVRELLGHADLPAIYQPLVQRFWPGPLTILLPLPTGQQSLGQRSLAPEVTAGLRTFGCRMPASPLARTLIRLADAPLAGPSANASTRPSPTTAQHVVDDLRGRITTVLDGGACPVGVESTVVDGLCDPPVVLRPGGVSLAQLRAVPGWERVARAYRDGGETPKEKDKEAPRAPGMKYKHYSPKARVVLYEGGGQGAAQDVVREIRETREVQTAQRPLVVGVVRTRTWPPLDALLGKPGSQKKTEADVTYDWREFALDGTAAPTTVLELDLGRGLASVAHGIFSALRDLDARQADVILVEGIADGQDDMAAAVMNRLRKAASEVR